MYETLPKQDNSQQLQIFDPQLFAQCFPELESRWRQGVDNQQSTDQELGQNTFVPPEQRPDTRPNQQHLPELEIVQETSPNNGEQSNSENLPNRPNDQNNQNIQTKRPYHNPHQ